METTATDDVRAEERRTVHVRCTGHVRSAVGTGALEFSFSGQTLRAFLDSFFDTYDVKELILADTESDASTAGWAPTPDEIPGSWRKNPPGDQTRRYARVTVNGVFNEHLEGLDTRIEDGDRIGLLYPFVFCV